MTFRVVPGGTEVDWTTSIQLKVPVLADPLSRAYGRLVRLGFLNLMRTAERHLIRNRPG